jgi:hypothetical protein
MGPPPPPPPLLVELPPELLLMLPPELVLEEPPPETAAAAGVTVVWAEPDLVESITATAVMVTVAGEGTVMGAVYTPVAEIVPRVALPPAVPLTLQFTAMLEEPVTAAANA